MKIVHLCLGCFYPDNYSYQENMLPKYHKKLGFEVEVIASLVTFDKNGKGILSKKTGTYFNEYGIKVTRLEYKWPIKLFKILKSYKSTYEILEKSKPDILFIHGHQFLDMRVIVGYLKRNKHVKVYVDNHVDFSNSAKNIVSKYLLHKKLWKYTAQKIEPYTTKFYGVLPARVDFLTSIYKINPSRVELLVMGACNEHVALARRPTVRIEIRKKFNIKKNDFLIITGGKIDKFKQQTLLLMKAVQSINQQAIKLIVFGSVDPDLKEQVECLSIGNQVQYIGWIPSNETYNYFAAAELVVFPGRHSVFWEQVAGLGVPMVCKYWEGTTHINIDGNTEFLYTDTAEEIEVKILEIYHHKYSHMKSKALNISEQFLYQKIAEKSIEYLCP